MKKGIGGMKREKMPVFGKYITLVTQTLRQYDMTCCQVWTKENKTK
jgi:hypothetical protein